jgi:hypothetical protein
MDKVAKDKLARSPAENGGQDSPKNWKGQDDGEGPGKDINRK